MTSSRASKGPSHLALRMIAGLRMASASQVSIVSSLQGIFSSGYRLELLRINSFQSHFSDTDHTLPHRASQTGDAHVRPMKWASLERCKVLQVPMCRDSLQNPPHTPLFPRRCMGLGNKLNVLENSPIWEAVVPYPKVRNGIGSCLLGIESSTRTGQHTMAHPCRTARSSWVYHAECPSRLER